MDPKELNLKTLLADWTDPDIARYYVACCLGIAEYDDVGIAFSGMKYVWWTQNPVSSMLDELLSTLVREKFVEFGEDEIQYRWISGAETYESIRRKSAL